jgi:hypothetical protein
MRRLLKNLMSRFLSFGRSLPTASIAAGVLLCATAVTFWTVAGRSFAAGAQQKPKPAKNAKGRAAPVADAPGSPAPLEQRPYRVRISVAFSGSAALLPVFRRQIMDSLRTAADRGYGRMFQAEFVTNGWVSPPSRLGLQRVEARHMLERFPEAFHVNVNGFDKVFLLTVEAAGPRFEICGREWDARSQQLGPVETAETYQLREVGQKAFSLVPRLFHPQLVVDSVKPRSVEMRLQGAIFPPVDPDLAQLADTDVVVPYFRYADKKDVVRRIQFLPWTYLSIESRSGAFSLATVISPYFGNPLGSGRRRNVEILATRVRPRTASSRLKMVYQTDKSIPLIGYNVQLVAKRRYRDEARKPPVTLFSGRDGYVQIPVDPDEPIVWVYVYSGAALLARVPYVPGITTDETIPLPDDSIRLSVEGEIELLRGRLIDTVARRATLMALAKMADDNEKLPAAQRRKIIDEKFREIYALPGREHFQTRLSTIREPSLIQARRLKNTFAEKRIKKLCDDTAKLIEQYLDMAPVAKFRGELQYGK